MARRALYVCRCGGKLRFERHQLKCRRCGRRYSWGDFLEADARWVRERTARK